MEKGSAEKEFEADDPLELVAVHYPVDSEREQDLEMARCFIEEYALMGWPGSQIRLLFKSPLYVGPHAIYTKWGLAVVDELIREIFRVEEVADGAGS
ncbi:MAG: hypothetical protein V3V82_03665 [Acidimicrobiia bacterium]